MIGDDLLIEAYVSNLEGSNHSANNGHSEFKTVSGFNEKD
jgi:hypothetical protein